MYESSRVIPEIRISTAPGILVVDLIGNYHCGQLQRTLSCIRTLLDRRINMTYVNTAIPTDRGSQGSTAMAPDRYPFHTRLSEQNPRELLSHKI